MATPAPPLGQIEEAVGEMVQSRVVAEEREQADADPKCQDQWGNLDITVIPASTGVVAYQTPDKRSGCPSKAGANKALISRTIMVINRASEHPSRQVRPQTGGQACRQDSRHVVG